ncbi:EAL domain-containing protein [Aquincola sp. S2]|uniref:EAL domain-containing protein n=1 Tax=Pseudaquabacterium terrae TaxID=2732868 RepID=A0ABX2EQW1_9BURK|nr:EAL domain-containing protein [Aquabacterium terrae]
MWGAGLALVIALLAGVLRQAAQEQLERDTRHSALNWAHLAGSTVPDLEALFEGRGVSPGARQQLERLRHASQVFRFKLFDRRGILLLVSDELDRDAASGGPAAAGPRPDAYSAPAAALAGSSLIVLKREQRPDRPAVYSEAYVPLLRDGRVLGIVEVYVDQVAQAASIERAFARVAGAVAALLSLLVALAGWQLWCRGRQQRAAEARMRYLAHHDVLSGVMNRTSFHEALRQASWRHGEGGPGFALLCIDLDHFKDVNDSLGHAAGDEVLRQAAQRLGDAVRHGDHVARLGGDEFAVLQTGVAGAADVTTLAERIVQALAAPYEAGGAQVHCSGSVGAAIHGVDATGLKDLLHKADLALYRAKSTGRSTFSFYDATMDEQLQDRRMLTRELRDAIAGNQLTLAYQPLHAANGLTLTGYEALLRWQHPSRGAVGPAEFIPLAEDSGLIDALGRWVLRRACADAAGWPEPLSVAVNLSAAQFGRGELVAVVSAALADAGLAPHRLELEITESLLMSNTEQTLGTLQVLSAMGIAIAMDDFGTGYSSLAYLWRFPFDKVKIDRAFTQNLGSDPKVSLIVHSIISLAHSLNIRVNAEGVETPAQMAALQAHGCDELQGFLLGHPRPLAALAPRPAVLPPRQAPRRGAAGHSIWDTPPTVPLPPAVRPTRPAPLG